ncbi:hypothetical protein [Pelagibius sp. Alg239-R121]|uniref:hypothetical protein n=1 Tax=Pelagibius sp. Alg239-R121 TaxID=2993448 RepID=UPI0024A755D5|nr:hypothetical protein [Pelagibius sp. Alg239-R121]
MTRTLFAVLSAVLFSGCVVFRGELEADPVTHMLLQLPALALAGVLLLLATDLRFVKLPAYFANAITLVAVFAVFFWMLPRYIDASLINPFVEFAKFLTLPTLVGASLALAWRQAHPFLRGFLKANAISMLGVLGFLYIHAPLRICNSYLVSDQQRLGYGFLIAAIAVSLAWTFPLFFPSPSETGASQSKTNKVTV